MVSCCDPMQLIAVLNLSRVSDIMSQRLPADPAPGPLEDYACAFDSIFSKRSQRESFRRYLEGLLLGCERNKTLTSLANTEPGVGATKPQAQRLQWFLSESTWDPEQINQQRLALLSQDEATAPDAQGVLIIDETGDRKWGSKTAHVGKQYLGSIGKIDNGVVSLTSLWADERLYYPVALEPYTQAHHFARGKADPGFRTKPQIALELVKQAVGTGIPFRAVVADNFYGENEDFKAGLENLQAGYVVALKPSYCWWHKQGDIGSVLEAALSSPWHVDEPCEWVPLLRSFRDGREEQWWALEADCGPFGPEESQRLIIVTTDPVRLPERTTWYLTTNLPTPDSQRAKESELQAADLDEVVRLYGLRVWVEQSYKQVKGALGWAQYQVRSALAIRRHWQLVCCAFSFCWWALCREKPTCLCGARRQVGADLAVDIPERPAQVEAAAPRQDLLEETDPRGKKPWPNRATPTQLARGVTESSGLAGTVSDAAALLASVVQQAPTSTLTSIA